MLGRSFEGDPDTETCSYLGDIWPINLPAEIWSQRSERDAAARTRPLVLNVDDDAANRYA
jgi:hypothetical protein